MGSECEPEELPAIQRDVRQMHQIYASAQACFTHRGRGKNSLPMLIYTVISPP